MLDVIICYLRNPFAAVKALMQVIEAFGLISSYKINVDKSVFFGFGISSQIKKAVSRILPGRWQADGIKYLGIKICRSKEDMVTENIGPIIKYIREKCEVWSTYPLSWLG